MVDTSHVFNRFLEVVLQFLLCNTAKRLVLGMHADIERLVEPAEDADLRKFGHAREEDELKVLVCRLEYGIEAFEDIAVLLLQCLVHIKHVQNRLVVFVNQYHRAASALFVGFCQDFPETETGVGILETIVYAVFPFPIRQVTHEGILQQTATGIFPSVEINMENRIGVPFLFQTVYFQSPEQFLAAHEVVFQGGDQQALSESSGSAQEVD